MTDQKPSKTEHEVAWEAHRRVPKFLHITRELEGKLERESYIYTTPDGSIELWRKPSPAEHTWNDSGYFGGVEVHSPTQLYTNQPPRPGHCSHVWGGQCWTTGSSLAFDEFENDFDSSEYIRGALASRHSQQFDGDESED